MDQLYSTIPLLSNDRRWRKELKRNLERDQTGMFCDEVNQLLNVSQFGSLQVCIEKTVILFSMTTTNNTFDSFFS